MQSDRSTNSPSEGELTASGAHDNYKGESTDLVISPPLTAVSIVRISDGINRYQCNVNGR